MYIVKDTNTAELDYLKENYNIKLDLDFENPTFYFLFKEDDNIIGYSEIKIENKIPVLKDFILEGDFNDIDNLFFLKGTGSKIMDLGFEKFVIETDKLKFYGKVKEIIDIKELFKGTCNDH